MLQSLGCPILMEGRSRHDKTVHRIHRLVLLHTKIFQLSKKISQLFWSELVFRFSPHTDKMESFCCQVSFKYSCSVLKGTRLGKSSFDDYKRMERVNDNGDRGFRARLVPYQCSARTSFYVFLEENNRRTTFNLF